MCDQRVGVLALEESNKRTLLGLTGCHMSKNLLVDRDQATDDEVLQAFDDLFTDRTCVLFDSFGSNDIDLICQRIQYMVRSLGVQWIILDHISILVSATEGDERRMLDAACTKFRTLVQELNIGMIMVSHLSRPSGDRGHESGAAVRLNSIRGSHSIAQLSDACVALQVDPDEPDSDIRHLRILKTDSPVRQVTQGRLSTTERPDDCSKRSYPISPLYKKEMQQMMQTINQTDLFKEQSTPHFTRTLPTTTTASGRNSTRTIPMFTS